MARVTVEDSLEKINNRFLLVMVASKRAKQLFKGSTPKISTKNNRQVVTALREIATGKIAYELTKKRSK